MKNIARCAAFVLVMAAGTAFSHADTVMADGSLLNQSAIPTEFTGNQGGYILFGVDEHSRPANLVSGALATGGYASNYALGSSAGEDGPGSLLNLNGYTSILVNETPVPTGVVYSGGWVPGTFVNLFNITLGANTPSSFIVSVLMDNDNNGFNNDTAVGVSVGGSPTVTQMTFGNLPASNDFYSFSVTGAMSGDVISISAETGPAANLPPNNNTQTSLIGGVAFSSAAATTAAAPLPRTAWGAPVLFAVMLLAKKFGRKRLLA